MKVETQTFTCVGSWSNPTGINPVEVVVTGAGDVAGSGPGGGSEADK